MTDPNAPQQGGMSDDMARLREQGADELGQTSQTGQTSQDEPAQTARQSDDSGERPTGGKRGSRTKS